MIDSHLNEILADIDKKFEGDNMYKMLGPTLLSYTSTDSSRMYMFTSHVKQVLTLLEPDVPRLQTGFERTIGEYNKAYKKLAGEWEVKDKIYKFSNGGIYTIVLYNKKTDTYDMIEKPIAENLTEKFGFVYNTDTMDSLNCGDKIKDAVIYKSTSYDKNMNYRYGKNARVFYTVSSDTLEDAIAVRKSWADKVKSTEVDMVQVSINGNDIPLNLYGNEEEYKSFPDIGESVNHSTLCATRRINKSHILYDFQTANMKETYDTDTEYFVSKDSVVYDIDVYYNGEEPFPDNLFYKQLKGYYDENCKYADEMNAWATKIKESGSNYTKNINFFKDKYQHYNDPEYSWKNKDKAFANIMVRFKVKSLTPLEAGSKLTGRYGDKGVISNIVNDDENLKDNILDMIDPDMPEEEKEKLKQNISIVDDERMPYMEDGTPVDLLLDMSGAIRRLDPEQLCEVETNFIAEQIQRKIKTLPTLEEKEDMIFRFLNLVSEDECSFFMSMYHKYDYTVTINNKNFRFMSPESKKAFIDDVEENGFYLVRPPHKPILYDDVKKMYDEFDWIKPVDLYINLFGIKKRKTLFKGIVGWKYILILKQNSNKNFSARSTYRINRSNLPAKDVAKKTNRSAYARTPVRLSEIYNLMASFSGRVLAEYNIFMRSSAIGRKSLDRILSAEGNPLEIKKLKVKSTFTNANADILNARLKAIGLRLNFITEDYKMDDVYENVVTQLYIDGYSIMDYPSRHKYYIRLFEIYKEMMSEEIMIESYYGEKSNVIWDKIFELDEVKEMQFTDNDKEMIKASTMSNLLKFNESVSKKSAKKPVADEFDEDGNKIEKPAPKKRGRKPKVLTEE